jgi:hypothetical protein
MTRQAYTGADFFASADSSAGTTSQFLFLPCGQLGPPTSRTTLTKPSQQKFGGSVLECLQGKEKASELVCVCAGRRLIFCSDTGPEGAA